MSAAARDHHDARDPFEHGVASGDPTSSSIVIWTAVPSHVAAVNWSVALDPAFTRIVGAASVETAPKSCDTPRRAHPVSVRVDRLDPDTVYHYRFSVDDHVSAIGRCSTLPVADATVEGVRIGLASCARLASASFQPYADLARMEPDLVVHLGDYIYEDEAAPHDPPEVCESADDYHRRHAQYRRQPPLRELHRVAPWVSVWDDHDVADDSWRSGSADTDDGRTDWERRRRAAEETYLDWLPQQASETGPTPMDRRLRIGSLADVVILDARNAARQRPAKESGPTLIAPDDARRIISDEQWTWLERCVAQCPGWFIMCTQTQVSPLRLARLPNPRRRFSVDPFVNPGQWDGYPVERNRLAATLAPVAGRALLCSGDLHGRFQTALAVTGDSSIPEITTPSIASTPFAEAIKKQLPIPAALLTRWLHLLNPHISFMELEGRGSTVLDVTPEAIEVVGLNGHGGELGRWRIHRGSDAIGPLADRQP